RPYLVKVSFFIFTSLYCFGQNWQSFLVIFIKHRRQKSIILNEFVIFIFYVGIGLFGIYISLLILSGLEKEFAIHIHIVTIRNFWIDLQGVAQHRTSFQFFCTFQI